MKEPNNKNKKRRKSQRGDEIDQWLREEGIKSSGDVKIPGRLVDQVIGQEQAVKVISKAAKQRRHVMLIGSPGTGKSMLGQAMAELLPREELEDIIVFPNPDDPNEPKIKTVPAGKGRSIVQAKKAEANAQKDKFNQMKLLMIMTVAFLTMAAFIWYNFDPMILFGGLITGIMLVFAFRFIQTKPEKDLVPKLLVSHSPNESAPFVDATGAHSGALLGDVKHDPFQSGGLETPPHERVEAGAIHRAHKGVLFIDEINLLKIESQQSLLTALQEKKFSITGQSERSSGAMVKTEAAPCDFVLVAAGNLDSVEHMHPALRSRIRGYGYEVFMKSTMKDSPENRRKLVRFIAQEVKKDGHIPHFSVDAIGEILREAKRRAGRKGELTLRLRELGGVVRAAGDIALEKGHKTVRISDVMEGKVLARPLEKQVADRYIEKKKEYGEIPNKGEMIGMVNGLAVMNASSDMNEYSGIVLRIAAEVTAAQSSNEGRVIATGKLGEIAKEAVQNVLALVKKHTGRDITKYDIHVQFIGTYEGVEGDSASISIATAVISALEGVPVDQNTAMTGSLSVRGDVLPVGGVTSKIEAAIEAGMKTVIIPKLNMDDVILDPAVRKKVKIVPVTNISQVLDVALKGSQKEKIISKLSQIAMPTNLITGQMPNEPTPAPK